MPILLALSVGVQAVCIIHLIRNHGDKLWFYIILLFPGVGSAIYFFSEVLPDLQRSRKARRAVHSIIKTIDPEIDLKRAAQELKVSDNVDNKHNLAAQCIEHELYVEAQELLESCLVGIYLHEPKVLFELARAFFLQGKYAEAKESLDRLIKENPDFKSQEGHLLYARCLEALEDIDAALEEYKVLASYYSGAEAKCRYALLLKKQGQTEQALRLFQELLDYAQNAPSFYRKAQKIWLDIAKTHL